MKENFKDFAERRSGMKLDRFSDDDWKRAMHDYPMEHFLMKIRNQEKGWKDVKILRICCSSLVVQLPNGKIIRRLSHKMVNNAWVLV